jgi:hypothetical protein
MPLQENGDQQPDRNGVRYAIWYPNEETREELLQLGFLCGSCRGVTSRI